MPTTSYGCQTTHLSENIRSGNRGVSQWLQRESSLDRYNIVSEGDLRLAAARQEEYLTTAVDAKTGAIPPE